MLGRTLDFDAKTALHVSRKWNGKVRMEALISQYFLARAVSQVEGKERSEQEVMRCIALADGINEEEAFGMADNLYLLPSGFASAFPEVMPFARQYWQSSSKIRSAQKASFVLTPEDVDLLDRHVGVLGNREGVSYWPIQFSSTQDETAPGYRSLNKEEIAAGVIEQCTKKNRLPARLPRTARVAALGSCFAINIANSLVKQGIRCESLRIEEIVNTTHANFLFLDQCLNGNEHAALESVVKEIDIRQLKTSLCEADLIVLTVGVAPIMEWVDTGQLCITDKYRPLLKEGRIRQRFTTVEENKNNIVNIVGLIRKHNPDVSLCITLSPVPLQAALEGESVIERDLLSKSTLKLAIDQAGAEADFFYWPSFEAVKWVAPHVPSGLQYQSFGADDNNSRHVSRWIIDIVVAEFVAAVFSDAPVHEATQ